MLLSAADGGYGGAHYVLQALLRTCSARLFPMQTSWLTPSEIFTPFYGRAIANFVLDKHAQVAAGSSSAVEPLRVFEVGGGTGTLARDILDHVRSAAPGVYESMTYTCVEISPRLAQLQEETAGEAAGHSHHFSVRAPTAHALLSLCIAI